MDYKYRNRRLWFGGVLLAWLLVGTVQAGEDLRQQAELKLGFFPLMSTVALFKRFMPLVNYLEAELEIPLVMETARDFPYFVQRTSAREYDIVVTAPHFALLAADSGKYRIVASLKKSLRGLLVVRANSPVNSVAQLAGRNVATPPKQAIITLLGIDYLDQQLTVPAHYKAFNSHNSAYEAVLGEQVEAAIVSVNVAKKALQKGVKLKVIGRTPPLPNMAVLIATDLPVALAERLQSTLVQMDSQSKGQEVLKSISLPGYRAAGRADYEATRPYIGKIDFPIR
jgi:phosphonate transport system substrate-binding protein